jgi:hypothetical protein
MNALKTLLAVIVIFPLLPFFGILLSIGVLLFLIGSPLWLTFAVYFSWFNKKSLKLKDKCHGRS